MNQKIFQLNHRTDLMRQGQWKDENTFLFAFGGQVDQRFLAKQVVQFSILAFCTFHMIGCR